MSGCQQPNFPITNSLDILILHIFILPNQDCLKKLNNLLWFKMSKEKIQCPLSSYKTIKKSRKFIYFRIKSSQPIRVIEFQGSLYLSFHFCMQRGMEEREQKKENVKENKKQDQTPSKSHSQACPDIKITQFCLQQPWAL